MAKKFGKFVLFTAAAAAACAGIYYYFQNKEKLSADLNDLDESDSNRSYVSLNHDEASAEGGEAPFEKLSSLVSDAAEKAEEKVEEFFDEDTEEESSSEE